MKNEVMTNGCSKDHTKEGANARADGRSGHQEEEDPGGHKLPDPAGEKIRKERKEEEGTTGTEQDRTGQGPIPPGKKEGQRAQPSLAS